MAEQPSSGQLTVLKEAPTPTGKLNGGCASLAYLIPWGTQSAGAALAELFRQNARVHGSDKPLKLNGTSFPEGTLIVTIKANADDLQDRITRLVSTFGIDV